MQKVKTLLSAFGLLGATVLVMAATTAAAQDSARIVAVVHGQASDPWWSVVKNGLQQAAEETGVDVQYRAPEVFDMVAMGQLIDAAVNQEPDGLIVSIPDADALGPSIENAVAAGIPVVSINSGSDVSASLGAMLHIGQEEFVAGQAAGEALKEAGGTKALCVNHEVGNVALDTRCEGFADTFGGEVTVLPTTNDPSEVNAKVKAALESDSEIDSILTLSATLAAEPAISAIEQIGRTGEVMIGSFDLSGNLLTAVEEGNALFAIDQQPFLQGYMPVSVLALYSKLGVVPSSSIASGPNLITQEKAGQVIELASKGLR